MSALSPPLQLGDSFLMPKPGYSTEHLWLLMTTPHPQSTVAIMVNITTRRQHSDLTNILSVGDHPFISRPSIVYYADARDVNTGVLAAAIQANVARLHQPFTQAVLVKIQAGIVLSPFTPRKIKALFLAEQMAGRT
jgi:hypothetical protein